MKATPRLTTKTPTAKAGRPATRRPEKLAPAITAIDRPLVARQSPELSEILEHILRAEDPARP